MILFPLKWSHDFTSIVTTAVNKIPCKQHSQWQVTRIAPLEPTISLLEVFLLTYDHTIQEKRMLTYDYLHRNSNALHRITPWISKFIRWLACQVQRWTACLYVNSDEHMNTGAGLAKRMGRSAVRHWVVTGDRTHKHTAGAATCTRPSQWTCPPDKKGDEEALLSLSGKDARGRTSFSSVL